MNDTSIEYQVEGGMTIGEACRAMAIRCADEKKIVRAVFNGVTLTCFRNMLWGELCLQYYERLACQQGWEVDWLKTNAIENFGQDIRTWTNGEKRFELSQADADDLLCSLVYYFDVRKKEREEGMRQITNEFKAGRSPGERRMVSLTDDFAGNYELCIARTAAGEDASYREVVTLTSKLDVRDLEMLKKMIEHIQVKSDDPGAWERKWEEILDTHDLR